VLAREPEKLSRRAPAHFHRVVFDDRRCDANFFAKRVQDLQHRVRMCGQGGQQIERIESKYLAVFQGNGIGCPFLPI